jgi:hypothetical protein
VTIETTILCRLRGDLSSSSSSSLCFSSSSCFLPSSLSSKVQERVDVFYTECSTFFSWENWTTKKNLEIYERFPNFASVKRNQKASINSVQQVATILLLKATSGNPGAAQRLQAITKFEFLSSLTVLVIAFWNRSGDRANQGSCRIFT